jgi:hypothetical protein
VKARIAILSLCLALTVSASAEKTPIALDCSSETGDTNGMQLCTELRDAIAVNPRYQETNSSKGYRWGLHVISITTTDSKESSAESVAITIASDDVEYYVTSYVLITGRNRVTGQAKTILAALDDQVNKAEKAAIKAATTQ